MGLEDLGVDLGDKYRDVDPTLPLSNEAVIENEHVFENGKCKDCGMTWIEYYYDVIGELDGDKSEGWKSVYGQSSEDCHIFVYGYEDYTESDIVFTFKQRMYGLDTGIVGYKYTYTLSVYADPGEYDEIFASKEDLDFACEVVMKIVDDDGEILYAWDTMSEKDIKELFEKDGCSYYIEQEFLDMVWEHHENMFESFGVGMANMETSLADIGISAYIR